MSETSQVDPTAMGLLLVGFILLVVGIFGINGYIGGTVYVSTQAVVILGILTAVALLFASNYAYKAGSNFGMAVFLYISLALSTVALELTGVIDLGWFVFVIEAIFFLIFMAWAYFTGSPILLSAVLFGAALVFLFLGLYLFFVADGNIDTAKIMCLVLGIFSTLTFLVSTYLGFALTGCRELKVF